ncbi:MAG: adenylate/guanylate cyclase domain-containing protein [Thermoplasmata archaeon]
MAATRRLAAIMFTDLVGFTASAQSDEAVALARVQEQASLARPLFASYGGRVIKSTGDGFLVEFDSALKAAQCAIEIQRQLRERNARSLAAPLLLRVGIHLGDVEEVDGDILGDTVNLASRIVPLALPGGVCLSEPVADQIRGKLPYGLERLAPKRLKGVREPLVTYRVVLPGTEREPPAEGTPLPRLAVLPLTNISSDPKDEYFSDGLTEELISVLSKIRGLRVIARTSVAQYKGTAKPIAQIGAELGVTAVLEGSVRKAGDELRISVQLVDVRTEEHRWAQSYDRKLENVFAIQAEVAEQTASALKLEMMGSDRNAVRARPTSNLVAYDLYLRGVQASRRFTPGVGQHMQPGRDATGYFEDAIRQDPQFSAAHSSLANHLLAIGGVTQEGQEAFSNARQHVNRALEIDPRSSDAHTARGNLLMQADFDWPGAESELRQALELNPNNSTAHFWYRSLLTVLQRYAEAKGQLDAGFELDPLWFLAKRQGVTLLALRGDWDEAVRLAEGLVENVQGDPRNELESRSLLAWVYAYVGRPLDAERVDRETRPPSDPNSRLAHSIFLGWLGKPRGIPASLKAWEQRAKSEYLSPLPVVQAYAQLGRPEEALSRLEEDIQNGESYLWAHYQLPYFDPIRDHPRFIAALERFHLPTTQSWRRPALRPRQTR